jgi:hypothetical protein
MSFFRLTDASRQFFYNNGLVLAGGKITTVTAGTTTPKTTYQDIGGITPHLNPIELTASGTIPAEIWGTTGAYDLIITDADDNAITTAPDITGINDIAAATANSEWVIYDQLPTQINGTSFSVTGNQTTTFHVGRRVRATDGVGNKYGTIVTSVFGSVTTVTMVWDSSSIASSLSSVAYGLISFENSAIYANSGRMSTGSVMCPCEGLTGAVSGTTGTYAAAYATLRNATNGEKSFDAISEAYDIDVSGVGGLDTGTKSTNTWYLFWLIGKADGTIDGILSVQAAAPTLPAGYTYWGFVGAAYYAATTFDAIEQIENKTARGVAIVVSAGTATTPTLVNLAAIAPLAARMAKGSLGTSRTPSGSSQVFVYSDSAGTLGEQLHQNSGGNTTATYAPFSSPLTTARSLWYKIDAGAGSAGYVRITGWEY